MTILAATNQVLLICAGSLYFVVWAGLGIFSWLHIRACPTPQEKKRTADRYLRALYLLVVGFACLMPVLTGDYYMFFFLLFFIPVSFLMYRHMRRNSFYCDSCGKRSMCRQAFARSFHCPHCGYQLR